MGKKPNMRDVAGEDHKPEKRGNRGIVTDSAGIETGAVKGDKSESGTNSYAKSTQAAVKALSKKLYPVSNKDIETLKKKATD